jgi:hypothetical protein
MSICGAALVEKRSSGALPLLSAAAVMANAAAESFRIL